MESILNTISLYAKERVKAHKMKNSLEELKELCRNIESNTENKFTSVLKKSEMSFICEIKKASPSKGIISEEFDYLSIAKDYEDAGADSISCLTEPKWFLGSDEIFKEIRKEVSIPMLRKDFTIDEYQIYQGKLIGANAILLICGILDTATINKYLDICEQLNIAALVEAHDEKEIDSAISAGAKIIGVNNRNLKDFSMNFSNTERLREKVPPEILFISESGIKTPEDISYLRSIAVDGVLIGETLMRSENKREMLRFIRGN